jgi:hypothetical protein
MRKTLPLAALAMSAIPAAGASWKALDTVMVQADYAFRRDTLVLLDYDVKPDTVAYLAILPVAGSRTRVPLQTLAGAYFYDFDYAAGHLWYQGLGTAAQYVLVHQNLDGKDRSTVGSSTKYRESIRAGGDRVAWIDYRHVTNQAAYNSEVYTAVAPALSEVRLTTDAAFQAKARTNGVFVAWLEYDAARTRANVVLHDTRTGSTTKVAAGAWHQDNPWLSDSLLVWTDYRQNPSQGDVWSYDLVAGEARAVCTASGHQDKPVALGRLVAWEDYRSGASADIRAWSPSLGKEVEVAITPDHSTLPRLDGGRVSWYEENSVVAVAIAELAAVSVGKGVAGEVGRLRRNGKGWSLELPATWSPSSALQVRWRDAKGAILSASWHLRDTRLEFRGAPPSAMFLEVRSGSDRRMWLVPGAIR